MLTNDVLREVDNIAESFARAEPFRYVVIDNFLQHDIADGLLDQFPSFKEQNAVNELGKVGRKAVTSNLASISPLYASVADYLSSDLFLGAMSSITRIPALKYDQQMFGGGTHENLHGQELDPHVDFNILPETGWHRRLNIIVYLNKCWREEWGGSIELHSNPREPADNVIKSFAPNFNRGIIFETNEYSWHGFPRIELPEDKRTLSRKSLSIYLYTEERPAKETAPPHGTFYVPRPLAAPIDTGYTLATEDVAGINKAIRQRDQLIALHQRQYLERSGEYVALLHQFKEMRRALRLPLLGMVRQLGQVTGYFPDDSAGPEVCAQVELAGNVDVLTLRGYLTARTPLPMEITLTAGSNSTTVTVDKTEEFFTVSVRDVGRVKDIVPITITSSQSISGVEAGVNDDTRQISFKLVELTTTDAVK